MAKTQKVKYPKQDSAEIERMVQWYGERYQEVHLVTCLNCNRIIGVECAPANGSEMVTDRGRAFFTYQDLCLSVRQRLDVNADGEKMFGYECACGNSTTLAAVERGHVATQTVTVDKLSKRKVHETAPIPASSPFEMAQAEITVRLASADRKADYEKTHNMERFESFKIERKK